MSSQPWRSDFSLAGGASLHVVGDGPDGLDRHRRRQHLAIAVGDLAARGRQVQRAGVADLALLLQELGRQALQPQGAHGEAGEGGEQHEQHDARTPDRQAHRQYRVLREWHALGSGPRARCSRCSHGSSRGLRCGRCWCGWRWRCIGREILRAHWRQRDHVQIAARDFLDARMLAQRGLVQLQLRPFDVELARLRLRTLQFKEQLARLVLGVDQRQAAAGPAAPSARS